MHRLALGVLPFALLAACQPAPASDDASSQTPMSPQAAVAAVRQVFEQYVDDWNAPNIDAVLAVLADDVVQMPPDTVIVGKEALSADWHRYLGENDDVWEPTIDEIHAAGNLVFIRTHSTETRTPKAGGESIISYGQGITVFRRSASGTWELVLEQWFEREPSM